MLVGTLATMPLAAVGFPVGRRARLYVAFSVAFVSAYVVFSPRRTASRRRRPILSPSPGRRACVLVLAAAALLGEASGGGRPSAR